MPVYTMTTFIVANQAHALCNVSGLVRQHFDLAIICYHNSLLLELIEISKTSEALLREVKEVCVCHFASLLTDKKRIIV